MPTRPPTRWTPTTSSESSKPSRNFRLDRQGAERHRRPDPRRDRGPGHDERARRGDRDETGDGTGRGTERGRRGRRGSSRRSSQPRCAAAVASMVFMKASAAVWLAASSEPGVEAEPAEPQQAGAEQHERQVVRLHLRLGQADALAEHERQGQARGTGVDVHRGATGEVEHAAGRPASRAVTAVELGAAEVEHPVRDGEVDERRPRCRRRCPRRRTWSGQRWRPRSARP